MTINSLNIFNNTKNSNHRVRDIPYVNLTDTIVAPYNLQDFKITLALRTGITYSGMLRLNCHNILQLTEIICSNKNRSQECRILLRIVLSCKQPVIM